MMLAHWTLSATPVPQCTQGKIKAISCHEATPIYPFMHWWMSHKTSPPCSRRPGRPSDPSIIKHTIFMTPRPLASLLRKNRKRWLLMGYKDENWLERMSAPLLIRAMTDSPRPGVGGQQATLWPTQPDRRLNRCLPVWAPADSIPGETALVKAIGEKTVWGWLTVSYMQMAERLKECVGDGLKCSHILIIGISCNQLAISKKK